MYKARNIIYLIPFLLLSYETRYIKYIVHYIIYILINLIIEMSNKNDYFSLHAEQKTYYALVSQILRSYQIKYRQYFNI